MSEDIAVNRFREYLRINTEQPNPNYEECKNFLEKYAKELGLDFWSFELVPGKPLVGMTLIGKDTTLPSLMLYSHTDVVPTFKEHWTHDPYSAYKDEHGNIYARGAQDMKCIAIGYLEAIRRLKQSGKTQFLRTIHLVFCPDEEIGSFDGMKKFVTTKKFEELNIGFSLDEGSSSDDDTYVVSYGERSVWWIKVKCPGDPGHGSRFLDNNAGIKLQSIINSFLNYREEQRKKFLASGKSIGNFNSINLTKIEGGVQVNVVPSEFYAWFDVRVTPNENFEEFENLISKWCKQAGPDVTYEFELKDGNRKTTPITKEDPFWNAFSSVLEEEGCKYEPLIFPGFSDSRCLRELGIRAIGFSPLINTPCLAHDHNEYLNDKVFLRGVGIYVKLIERLANVQNH
uniref:N-acyl-aliphatic-L-amino acid amidohydrolase n=1 Tax=Acrobeloides nanus TaxID=290746 RepID=A0A914DJJ2_9BILA